MEVMKVKHFLETMLGYRTPPLEESVNAWLEEMGEGIKIHDFRYSASVATASTEEFASSETLSITGVLILYEEV